MSPRSERSGARGPIRAVLAALLGAAACSCSDSRPAGEGARENCAMMGPCATSLDDCPTNGCDPADDGRGRLSIEKRTLPESVEDPIAVNHDILVRLQELSDAIVGTEQLYYPTPAEWAQLAALDVDGLVLGEGDVVALGGWLVGRFAAPMGAEPVNCCLEDEEARDWHLPLVATRPAGDPTVDSLQYGSIITEAIPQYRLPGWSLEAFRALSEAKTQVKMVGRLMYDSPHRPHTEPEPDENAHPRRISSWEVHPVVEIWQCPTNDCDVASTVGWDPIE